jgi:hypothetical protein
MDIQNPRYLEVEGYPWLQVELDGEQYTIPGDQKESLTRQGIVIVPGFSGSVLAGGGKEVQSAIKDRQLWITFLSFALDCRHGRFEDGGKPSISNISPKELLDIGYRIKFK